MHIVLMHEKKLGDDLLLKLIRFKSRDIKMYKNPNISGINFKNALFERVKVMNNRIFENCIEPP